MKKAEILGHGESCSKPARRVGSDRGDLERGRRVFAAVIFRLRNLPASFDRTPDQLEIRVGRQTFCRDPDRCPGRATLGRHCHPPDETVRRGERRIGAELRG